MKPTLKKTKTRTKAGRTASLRCDALVRLSWVRWRDILNGLENGESMWKTHAEQYRTSSTYNKPGAPIHPVHRRIIQQYARALKAIKRMEPNDKAQTHSP